MDAPKKRLRSFRATVDRISPVIGGQGIYDTALPYAATGSCDVSCQCAAPIERPSLYQLPQAGARSLGCRRIIKVCLFCSGIQVFGSLFCSAWRAFMGLRADVPQEDELMRQEDCVVNVWSHVWLCVWVLQFTGRAEITEDLLTGGATQRIFTGPKFREH